MVVCDSYRAQPPTRGIAPVVNSLYPSLCRLPLGMVQWCPLDVGAVAGRAVVPSGVAARKPGQGAVCAYTGPVALIIG